LNPVGGKLNKTRLVNGHVAHVKSKAARGATCHCNNWESTSQKVVLRFSKVKYNLLKSDNM